MARHNRLLEKLRNKQLAIGCQVRSRSAMIAEIFGYAGFDYVFVENEHFGYSIESVEEVVRACELANTEAIVRIPDHDPAKILQYLDLGASGLLLPHVENGAQARAIVDAGKYRPQGKRGFSSTSRATRYGDIRMDEYKALANANTMLIPFIECETAVANLDDILGSGIDAIHIGPGDLSETIPDPAELRRTVDAIIQKANAAGIPAACVAASVEDALDLTARGVSMISYASDLMLLKEAASAAVTAFRKHTGGPS